MASHPFPFSSNLCLTNHLPPEAAIALILECLFSNGHWCKFNLAPLCFRKILIINVWFKADMLVVLLAKPDINNMIFSHFSGKIPSSVTWFSICCCCRTITKNNIKKVKIFFIIISMYYIGHSLGTVYKFQYIYIYILIRIKNILSIDMNLTHF